MGRRRLGSDRRSEHNAESMAKAASKNPQRPSLEYSGRAGRGDSDDNQKLAVEMAGLAHFHHIQRAEGGHSRNLPGRCSSMARLDSEDAMWARWTREPGNEDLSPRPFVEPIQRWFSKKGWDRGTATAAHAVAAGLWTQQAAFQAGEAPHEDCAFCLSAGSIVAGSAGHRLGTCPAYNDGRRLLDQTWQHLIATGSHRKLWERGLEVDPAARYIYRPQPEMEIWETNGSEEAANRMFTGEIATDGSKTGTWRSATRTGWSVTMLDPASFECVLCVLPHSLPVQRTIARAELHSVLVALRNALPPLSISVDCALVLTGLANGRKWCVYSGRPNADIWKKIWNKLEDIGLDPSGAAFNKVKAHVSALAFADADAVTKLRLLTNAAADIGAKAGAEMGGAIRSSS